MSTLQRYNFAWITDDWGAGGHIGANPDPKGNFYRVGDVNPFIEPRPISDLPEICKTNWEHLLVKDDEIGWIEAYWHPIDEGWYSNNFATESSALELNPTHFLLLPATRSQ